MDDKERLEQKLQAFYDRVPDVEDALPFKDYVLKHEDSRMAWYLLGKQYESRGQSGKAAYCYSQAGEIYEAFENQAPPAIALDDAPKQPRTRRGLAMLAASGLLTAGLLMNMGLASAPSSAGYEPPAALAEAAREPAARLAASPQTADRLPPAPAPLSGTEPAYAVFAGTAGPDDAGAALLASITARAAEQGALMIEAPRLDRWTDWLQSGRPVVSALPGSMPGAVALQWHDAEWCGCAAAGGLAALQAAEQWKPVQEMKLALRSAMIQYHSRTGKWPEKPDDLAGAYPNNIMAGWTDEMNLWFGELTDKLGDDEFLRNLGWPSSIRTDAGYAVPAGALEALTQMPLEIIVDVSNHRLAVVSGNVLLRNYEVGLGGERTPEGTFFISEKVRNPNGREDGEFGSRGMTLSDTLYAIHGTNDPDSIGKDDSLGCIRMAKADLEELYDMVPVGTAVTITKGVLPPDIRVPEERFSLPAVQDETNPHKVYKWLN